MPSPDLPSSPSKTSRKSNTKNRYRQRLSNLIRRIFRFGRLKEKNKIQLANSVRHGQYDPDAVARSLPIHTPSSTSDHDAQIFVRGRNVTRQDIKTFNWSHPLQDVHNRSRSISPVAPSYQGPLPPNLPLVSTPNSSRRWKFSVLESLHIASPSMALTDVDVVSESKSKMTAKNLQKPKTSTTHVNLPSNAKSKDSGPSLHLQSLNIPTRLRATSSFASANLFPTSSDAYHQQRRRFSTSAFGSDEVPPSWGQVLALPASYDLSASSIYSSQPNSPILSQVEIRPIDGELNNRISTHKTFNSSPIILNKKTTLPTNPSTSSLGKESKFKEELDISAPSAKRHSVLNFLHKTSQVDKSINGAQTPTQSVSAVPSLSPNENISITNSNTLSNTNNSAAFNISDKNLETYSNQKNAIGTFAKAIQATVHEREAFLLPQNKHLSRTALTRARSASHCTTNEAIDQFHLIISHGRFTRSASDSHLPLSEAEDSNIQSLGARFGKKGVKRTSSECVPPTIPVSLDNVTSSGSSAKAPPEPFPLFQPEEEIEFENSQELGAWGRYPSHTREARTGSAGPKDAVYPTDFAYQLDTLPETQRALKRGITAPNKGKKGLKWSPQKLSAVQKSKQILKHYGNFFRSPSLDYLIHGYGRRTSTNVGGTLHDPDSEIPAEVWAPLPLTDDDIITSRMASCKVFRKASWRAYPQTSRLSSTKNSFELKYHINKIRETRNLSLDLGRSTHSPIDGSAENDTLSKVISASSPDLRAHPLESTQTIQIFDDTCLLSLPYPTLKEVKNKNVKNLALDNLKPKAEQASNAIPLTNPTSPITPAVSSMYSEPYSPCLSLNAAPLLPCTLLDHSALEHGQAVVGEAAAAYGHAKNQSVVSIRQSSYDLLLMLQESEERERRKALGSDAGLY